MNNTILKVLLKKYWYLYFLHVFFSYILSQVLVFGSSRIAKATDSLFAGEILNLQEFILPFIILMLLGGAASFGQSYSKNTFSTNIQADIRNMLVRKLVNIRIQYFDAVGTGTLMNKLLSDINQIESLFAQSIPEFLVALITIICTCSYIGIQNVRLLLITIFCYPMLLFIVNLLTKVVGKIADVRRQLYDNMENATYDIIQGILIGKTYNLYQLQKNRISIIMNDILKNENCRTKILAVYYIMHDLMNWIPKLVCYLFCLYEVNYGRMSVGIIFSYIMLLDHVAKSIGIISSQIPSICEYGVSVKRLQDILNQEEEHSGIGDFAPNGEVIMELSHVSFGYTNKNQILKDVSLTIKKGSNVAFIGKSGSGKSTVMKILCGFYYPQEGQYRIFGHNFSEWNVDALRKHISLVSQNVFLFPGTIAQNVAYGKPNVSIEEIVEACKKANIHDFIAQLPQGYETKVGERGINFSGGQKQRISIARALLKNAPILLLDEPTSSVDMETEQSIQDALKEIVKDRTVITIAHRLSIIVNAEEVYLFKNGKIIKEGAIE
ncbi:ABC transporter ATP-binding protein [Lachnospiraceae bacterium MD335]|mgnify:CR=1|nr:ABC transporter ATP-binding protein [Lachnospiraceae bacterium MD335]